MATAEEVAALRAQLADQATFIAGLRAGTSRVEPTPVVPVPVAAPVELHYVPHYDTQNPHASRPRTVLDCPQHFDLSASPTYRSLQDKPSPLKYEFRTLEAGLSYLYDSKTMLAESLPSLTESLQARVVADSDIAALETEAERVLARATNLQVEEHVWIFEGLKNSLEGIYRMFAQRADFVRLKVRYENKPGGMSLTDRTFLNYLETKLHGVADGLTLTDDDVNKWLEDFGEKSAAATMTLATKTSAGHFKGKGAGKGGKGGEGGKGGKGGADTDAGG